MIVFDTMMLVCAAHELRQRIIGARVEKITQPSEYATQWLLYGSGRKFTVFCETSPESSRLHLTTRGLASPPTPPMFCMLLRKLLSGAYIEDITLPRGMGERIVKIDFVSEGLPYSYYIELMGRRGNQIVVSENGFILGSIKRVTTEMSRVRPIRAGIEYELPPMRLGAQRNAFGATAGNALPVESFDTDKAAQKWVMETFHGVSPLMAAEAVLRRPSGPITSETVWFGLNNLLNLARLAEYSPILTTDNLGRITGCYPVVLKSLGPHQQATAPSFGEAIDDAADSVGQRSAFEHERAGLVSALRRALKALEHEKLDIDEGLLNAGRADEYRICGNLILANQPAIQTGMTEIELPDYTTGADVSIELDPKLTAQQNAERYFKRYRKARDSRERLEQREADVAQRIVRVEEALPQIESTQSLEALDEFSRKFEDIRARALENHTERGKPEQEISPYAGYKVKVFHSVDGWEILVGENATSNDFITTKVAAPSDIWLHARSQASAHAVIRAKNKPGAVSPVAIRYAAEQVAKRSASKHSRLVPVDYTLKKYVRKPRGSAAGAALYSREKTIDVTPD